MRAKSFFFVCLGILALALTYHVGSETARAQSTGSVECIGGGPQVASAVVNHRLYTSDPSSPTGYLDQGPVPGSGRAVACGAGPSTGTVVMEDGTVWSLSPSGWSPGGFLPIVGPTPARHESMGAVKARYR